MTGAIHPGEIIAEELMARGWTVGDLSRRMPGDPTLNELSLGLYIHVRDIDLLLDKEVAQGLAVVFGTSVAFWRRLDAAWRTAQRQGER